MVESENVSEEETLKQEPSIIDVLNELAKINRRLDGYDSQFESIRQGLVDNQARFDRLEGNFLLLRAGVTELTEEIRHNRKILV
jgi:peptidoglycan hydrolase CwlO-like protein